jgi:hypothetical protein
MQGQRRRWSSPGLWVLLKGHIELEGGLQLLGACLHEPFNFLFNPLVTKGHWEARSVDFPGCMHPVMPSVWCVRLACMRAVGLCVR